MLQRSTPPRGTFYGHLQTEEAWEKKEMYNQHHHKTPDMEAKALDFILIANRNLFLSLTVSFGACAFAVTADGLVKHGQPNTSGDGILSGICVGMSILIILISGFMHIYMVYKHNKLMQHNGMWWWYLMILAMIFVSCTPLVTYLILLC
jgi:hypothetical protein